MALEEEEELEELSLNYIIILPFTNSYSLPEIHYSYNESASPPLLYLWVK